MRVSTDDDDPGFENWQTGRYRKCKVFVDGKRVERPIMFDTEEGVVLHFKADESGRVVVSGTVVETEELRGVVTYELAPQP